MNESVFKEILGEALKCGLAEYGNAPEHKFSLKHKLAMKKVFARYERNVGKLCKNDTSEMAQITEYKSGYSFKRNLLVAMLVIILMAFLVGWVVVFVSEKFHGTVYHDYTLLNAVDIENCPQTIEYKYALAVVPDGFEMTEITSSPFSVYTLYKNKKTGQEITLWQDIKTDFRPHLNTEHHQIEEITVNGKLGLYIDFSIEGNNRTALILDNGDYILCISADFNKSETLNLANFNKI